MVIIRAKWDSKSNRGTHCSLTVSYYYYNVSFKVHSFRNKGILIHKARTTNKTSILSFISEGSYFLVKSVIINDIYALACFSSGNDGFELI